MYKAGDIVEMMVPDEWFNGGMYTYTAGMILIFRVNPRVEIRRTYSGNRYQIEDCHWNFRWVEESWIKWPYRDYALFL